MSAAVHVAILGFCFLVTHRLALFGGPPVAMDFALAGGTPPPMGGPVARPPTSVSDLLTDDDLEELVPLTLDATTAAPKMSADGSVAVKRKKNDTPEPRKQTDLERIARIRQGLRKTDTRSSALARLGPAIRTGSASANSDVDANSLADQLLGQIRNQSIKVSAGGWGTGGRSGSGRGDSFLAAVSTVLHERWNQPSRAEIAKGSPTVGASITVRADGTVTAFQLTRASGVAILDDSVERLLRALRRLPTLASYGLAESVLTIQVTFAID